MALFDKVASGGRVETALVKSGVFQGTNVRELIIPPRIESTFTGTVTVNAATTPLIPFNTDEATTMEDVRVAIEALGTVTLCELVGGTNGNRWEFRIVPTTSGIVIPVTTTFNHSWEVIDARDSTWKELIAMHVVPTSVGGGLLATEATALAILAKIDEQRDTEYLLYRDSANGTFAQGVWETEDGGTPTLAFRTLDNSGAYIPVGTMEPIRGRISTLEDRYIAWADSIAPGEYVEGDVVSVYQFMFYTITGSDAIVLGRTFINTTTNFITGSDVNKGRLRPENNRPSEWIVTVNINVGSAFPIIMNGFNTFGATEARVTSEDGGAPAVAGPVIIRFTEGTPTTVVGEPLSDLDTVPFYGQQALNNTKFISQNAGITHSIAVAFYK